MSKAQPVRLQLSRRKGFSLQALSIATNGLPAVNVARPSRWGNPFKVGAAYWAATDEGGVPQKRYVCSSAKEAVACFENFIDQDQSFDLRAEALAELAGKNLACFCKPGAPCHGDTLLRLANPLSGGT